ncbi:MAG: glycosyltransferase [Micromonosporaceae bacterium]|nr:glycosyltransferase [Micromonosporaceae bacterium]
MVTRRPAREPRWHWPLLSASLLVLLGGLCLNGYAKPATGAVSAVPGAEPSAAPSAGSGVAPDASPGAPDAPRPDPVHRVAADGSMTSRGMPALTIALTFDGGPDPVWTPRILEVLDRHHAQATFFQLGSMVNRYPELSKRIIASGSEVGVRSFTNADLTAVGSLRRSVELTLAGNAIVAATGRRPVLLRPSDPSDPSDRPDPPAPAEATGYLTVLADRDTGDDQQPGAAAIIAAARPAAGEGAVVSMHDAGGDRSQTVAALDQLIPQLQAAGYRFVTVSAALGLAGSPVASAGERWRGYGLRLAQRAGGGLADLFLVFTVLMVIAGILRLLAQMGGSWIHERRSRRHRRGPFPVLGRVSVIVPAYNEAANIAAAVRSIAGSHYPDLEVIVVDDGSADATADLVDQLGLPQVRVVRQPNAGKPAALNNGLRHATGDILVFVDGDTVLEADTVSRLVAPLRDHRVGAVSGYAKVVNRAGLLGRWQHLEYVVGFNLDRRMLDAIGCMPTIPGAIGAFRRAALHDTGGVSAQTLAEDTDLTMSIIRAGWQVVYEPAAVAWTEAPATLRQLWRQRYRWSYGTLQVLWKHRRSMIERGPAGRLGRRCLPYLALFQVLLPLAAPVVDVYGVYGLLSQPFGTIALAWAGFTVIQLLTTAYTLWLDREPYGPLWAAPLQQILYRQLNYLVVVQALVMALLGARLRWQRMHRTGAAAAYAQAAPA